MKILHLSTGDNFGGAARAAYRLHTGLRAIGVNSWMLVKNKETKDPSVLGKSGNYWKGISFIERQIDKLPIKLYFKRKHEPFNTSFFPNFRLLKQIKKIDPDVINIHWINAAFISVGQLKEILELGKPVVITLHDSWFFTGGCHIPQTCEGYKNQCGDCPLLNSGSINDLSRRNLLKKRETYKDINFTVVAPSMWLKSCAKSSYLLGDKRIFCIPNAIDTNIFKPLNKNTLKNKWGFRKNKKYILFGAVNALEEKNKGFYLLKEILENVTMKNCELLIFGSEKIKKIDVPIPYINLGYIHSLKDLVEIYSMADVFAGPSLQESFGQTFLEAMSCGTPCVAFDYSGPKDFISHKEDGYLAAPYEIKDFANGIEFCLSNPDLGTAARNKIENRYALDIVAKEYLELYKSLQ